MTPIVNGLANEYENEITIYQLNAAEREVSLLQQQYEVRGHPSFVILRQNGEVAARYLGPQDEHVLRGAIDELRFE